jgi:RNA polymerase sigma-70 factor (ECF subfamily)
MDRDAACLHAFQRELDYIYATLRRLGAAASDIDDRVQDVFVALRGAWGRRDHTQPLRPYLFGIAFRIVSAHRRKQRHEVLFKDVDGTMDGAADLDEAMQGKQAHLLVHAALERVPLKRRAVLLMHDLDEVPVADVASVLGIRLFTAYGRLRKARRELAVALRLLLEADLQRGPGVHQGVSRRSKQGRTRR